MAESNTRPSRISHGAVHVLAYLHETDASCSEIAHETVLGESTAYRWLTELTDVGILEADVARINSRAVIMYRLEDDALGAAAQVVADRL